jgi:Domain of unknown function (DUF1848)
MKACLMGNREECGCFESRDIGEYDTCPHGCVYCYAVQNQELAKTRYKQHDPLGESLFPLPAEAVQSAEAFAHPQISGAKRIISDDPLEAWRGAVWTSVAIAALVNATFAAPALRYARGGDERYRPIDRRAEPEFWRAASFLKT